MCGIVGSIGSINAVEDVINGLKRLEYRGYDSAGVATLEGGEISLRKSVGKMVALDKKLAADPFGTPAPIAIGHTRWATHGEPSEINAHPHKVEGCAVVHNGIIENFMAIREEMEKKGIKFKSQTDTETIPALINNSLHAGKKPLEATLEAIKKAQGAFAFGAIFEDEEEMMIATRRSAPLVVGIGQGSNYIASDPMAIAGLTNRFIFPENDDVVVLTPKSVEIYTLDGKKVARPVKILDISAALTGKGAYRHFMHKEIHEQPEVIGETLATFMADDWESISFPELNFDLATVPQINIIACGTSYYAANVAKYWIEKLAGKPVNIDIASEFRYRKPPLVKGGLSIFISQSGETADTLAALEHVKAAGQYVLSIVNVPQSTIARESDAVLLTKAGPEIGVASTKAFTTQLVVLSLIALKMGEASGALSKKELAAHLTELRELPARMAILPDLDEQLHQVAHKVLHTTGGQTNSALYLGRDNLFPIAMEGALKLKEISYIHAEGYAAGEMKHGPIALIDEDLPVVVLAPSGELFEKNISNMQEVEARRGKVFLFTDKKGAQEAGEHTERTTVLLPEMAEFVQPIFYALPMQLLAYHVAVLKGTDVDQPRNLAKSVTVE